MKKVTMYTGDPCSFCDAAKALLKTKNVQIEELDIWKDSAKANPPIPEKQSRTFNGLVIDIILMKEIVFWNILAFPTHEAFFNSYRVLIII